jgi:hypothetical protein
MEQHMPSAPQTPQQEELPKKTLEEYLALDERTLLGQWGTIPEEHKAPLLDDLINIRKTSFFVEDVTMLAEGNMGAFINRLIDSHYQADTLMDEKLLPYIFEKSLSKNTYDAFKKYNLPSYIDYCKDHDLFEDTVTFE